MARSHLGVTAGTFAVPPLPPLSPPARSSDAPEIARSYAHCRRLCAAHYENFPVASRWISEDLRGPVSAVYAFSRTADDFADEPGPAPAERLALLADWRRRLEGCLSNAEGHPVFTALADTIRRYGLPLDPFHRLITAFEQDVTVPRHPTFAHVQEYCRHSANPVGELVLRLHRVWTPERGAWSDQICTALQLANFWQDVTVDARKNRIYIPMEDLPALGLSESDVLNGPADDNRRTLIARQVARTWTLFDTGRPLLENVPRTLRTELRLVWLGGTEILRKIEQANFDVWSRRPTLSKWDWARLFGKMLLGAPRPTGGAR